VLEVDPFGGPPGGKVFVERAETNRVASPSPFVPADSTIVTLFLVSYFFRAIVRAQASPPLLASTFEHLSCAAVRPRSAGAALKRPDAVPESAKCDLTTRRRRGG
jgi:hypothetical protein